MVTRDLRNVLLGCGLVGAIAAAFLPWSHYGGIEISLNRLPGWIFYLASVILQQLWMAILVFRSRRGPPVLASIGLVVGVATAALAVSVVIHFDDARAIFGNIVPPISPRPGIGGILAIVAALSSTLASASMRWSHLASDGLRSRRTR